jgi:DNA polymerase-1
VNTGSLLELAETLYPPFSDLLYSMERAGVYVSIPELERIASEAERDIDKARSALDTFSGQARNWNAGAEVAEFLYDQLGLPELPDDARSPKFWNKERITAHEAIEYWYRHYSERRPELDSLRAYRRACRGRNYATDLIERARPDPRYRGLGVVHPTYGTYSDSSAGRDRTGTATGRLSVSNPPLQQIPRDKKRDPYRVRRAFVAPPGHRLCVVDMQALEVRIQAHVHIALFGDTTLRDMCLAGDFHGRIAHKVFSQIWPTFADHVGGWAAVDPNSIKDHPDAAIRWCRDQVKAVYYGLAYGRGPKTFAKTLWTIAGDPVGLDVATGIVDGIFKEIPAVPRFKDWVRQTVAEKGGMWDMFGIWRPLERDNRGARQGENQPFQGSGARLVMLWMLKLRGLDQRMQTHDEIGVIATEDNADKTVKVMEMAAFHVGQETGMHCPLEGKGGHAESWEEAK